MSEDDKKDCPLCNEPALTKEFSNAPYGFTSCRTVGAVADKNTSKHINAEPKPTVKTGPGAKLPEGSERIKPEKGKKPWFAPDKKTTKKIQEMTPLQKEKYIQTGES
jgi:hypothetical protein